MLRYTLYAAVKKGRLCFDYSSDLRVDAEYLRRNEGVALFPLVDSLPIGLAHLLKGRLESGLEARVRGWLREKLSGKGLGESPDNLDWALGVCRRALKQVGVSAKCRVNMNRSKNLLKEFYGVKEIEPKAAELQSLVGVIRGRVILLGEVKKIRQKDEFLGGISLAASLQWLYLMGYAEIVPGVGYTRHGELSCFRCGSSKKVLKSQCARCGAECYYCEECILLGASRLCEPLVVGKLIDSPNTRPEVQPIYRAGRLTEAQKGASEQLRGFILDKQSRFCLVLAVCGAGKTEVSFLGIAEALRKGYRVLYAVPRRDVVMELQGRFQAAFPKLRVVALYGGSPDKYAEADLTLATTHQAMRFKGNFDLLILDEADAYPYRGSQVLPKLLKRACKPNAKVIYMSATPDRGILSEVRARGLTITIPARYHGRLLPVPQLLKVAQNAKGSLEPDIVKWLYNHGVAERAPVLIFLPTVAGAKETAALINKAFGQDVARYVHAGDPERDSKKEAFRLGSYPFLVTTTILERGITVANVNVLVIAADNEKVFTAAALVQIAGRSGRTADYPQGKVCFTAKRITPAIREAIAEIEWYNKVALEKGMIL